MTCDEFEELSGAYALDAITPAEREAAQAHLAGCAACTRHLQELRAVVDVLPYSAPQVNPPESLKGRVLEAIRLGGMTAWNVSLQQQNSSLQQQNASLQHQLALAYGLHGNGVTGKLIYLPEQNITVLVINGLPELHGTQVYQGWLIHGKQPTSIGLLSMQNGVASVIYPGTIAGYQVAAVSREPGPTASKNVPAGPVVAGGALKQPVVV